MSSSDDEHFSSDGDDYPYDDLPSNVKCWRNLLLGKRVDCLAINFYRHGKSECTIVDNRIEFVAVVGQYDSVVDCAIECIREIDLKSLIVNGGYSPLLSVLCDSVLTKNIENLSIYVDFLGEESIKSIKKLLVNKRCLRKLILCTSMSGIYQIRGSFKKSNIENLGISVFDRPIDPSECLPTIKQISRMKNLKVLEIRGFSFFGESFDFLKRLSGKLHVLKFEDSSCLDDIPGSHNMIPILLDGHHDEFVFEVYCAKQVPFPTKEELTTLAKFLDEDGFNQVKIKRYYVRTSRTSILLEKMVNSLSVLMCDMFASALIRSSFEYNIETNIRVRNLCYWDDFKKRREEFSIAACSCSMAGSLIAMCAFL